MPAALLRAHRRDAPAALVAALVLMFLAAGAAPAAPRYAPIDAPGPPLSASPAALAASLRCTPDVRGARREPVLLLAGTTVNSDENFAWNYERALTAARIPYCLSDLPGDASHNLGDIQLRGEYVTYAIREAYRLAGRRVAVAGWSQGGAVMRWSLRFWPDTRALVEDVVGIAGSNHGSEDPVTCAVQCQPAFHQQNSLSNFTAAINSAQETFAGIDYTEVYTHYDEIVRPNLDDSGTSALHGPGRLENVAVQDVCPNDTSDHLALGTSDPVAYALLLDALGRDGPASPGAIGPDVCAQGLMPGIDRASYPTTFAAFLASVGANVGAYPTTAQEPPLACYVTASCARATPTGSPAPAQQAAAPRLRVSVAPSRITACRGSVAPVRVRVTDARDGRAIPLARVRVAGRAARADRLGEAIVRIRLRRSARRHVSAAAAGYPRRSVALVTRTRACAPTPTG